MKTPAEKCAETICEVLCAPCKSVTNIAVVTAIIQSEYAETFKVAREAITSAINYLTFLNTNKMAAAKSLEPQLNEQLKEELRTALELMK